MLTEVDFRASNNADWKRSFSFNNGIASTVPWNAVAAWAATTVYQSTAPASVVTNGGDLYVANPANSPTGWTSASTFVGDAGQWVKIGDHTLYNPTPYDLTGAKLAMAITSQNTDGTLGNAPTLTLSSDAGTLTITDAANGAVTLNAPAAEVRKLSAGTYLYDLLAIYAGGAVSRLMFGTIEVDAGITPP